MRQRIIEGGIYFLLLFTPLAFGGVERWAVGVLQVVAGVVFVAWAWEDWPRTRRPSRGVGRPGRRERTLLIGSLCLFAVLVLVQLVPLPPGWIRRIAPATHGLYLQTVPGVEAGRRFDAADLESWLLVQASGKGDQVRAEAVRETGPVPREDPEGESGWGRPLVGGLQTPADGTSRRTPGVGWRTLSIYPFATRENLAIFLCYAGLFVVVADRFGNRKRCMRLLGVMVLAGFMVSLFGILQKLGSNDKLYWIRETDKKFFFGPFINRNSFAAFAGTILPVAICLSLASLRQLRGGRQDVLPRFIFFTAASVAMAGGVFYSLSRGGMIAVGCSVLVVAGLLLYYGRRGLELGMLGLLLVLAVGFLIWIGPGEVAERVGTLSRGASEPSLTSRVRAWRQAGRLVADHPLVGTGLGTFRFAFQRDQPPDPVWWDVAHNEYLELVCDTGLAGAALFLVGLAAYLRLVMRPGQVRGRTGPFIYTGLVAGMAGLLLHSAVSSNLQVPANGLLLVILGGQLMGFICSQEKPDPTPPEAGAGRRHAAPGAP